MNIFKKANVIRAALLALGLAGGLVMAAPEPAQAASSFSFGFSTGDRGYYRDRHYRPYYRSRYYRSPYYYGPPRYYRPYYPPRRYYKHRHHRRDW